ncbi:hypothetical protein T08_7254 [Trichinella sp. T8]|nr:hypothetical protein T08_7254 [Trichinella sp. T8]
MVYEVLQHRSNATRLDISTTKVTYSSVKLQAEKKMRKPNSLDVLALRPNDYNPIVSLLFQIFVTHPID